MNKFKKYPSTQQFSGAVKQVRDHCKYHEIPVPILNFTGSIKIHGSNAAIGFNTTGDIWFQSRERVLDITQDNAGFCLWGEHNKDKWKGVYEQICLTYGLQHDRVYIYGEWFGSSIQRGVAVSQLNSKKFGIFKIVFVKYNDNENFEEYAINHVEWNTALTDLFDNVFVIDAVVPPFELTIDFNEPHLAQNKLLELTLAVENECPIGKYFGVVDGCTTGEGIVWSTDDVEWVSRFKTKGEKHSVSKVVTIRELTEAEISSKNSAAEFVEFACTTNRLEQGIDKLKEMGLSIEIRSMGAFLKWVGSDIMKECHDVLVVSYIDKKDVMGPINNKAKKWFMEYINSNIGVEA